MHIDIFKSKSIKSLLLWLQLSVWQCRFSVSEHIPDQFVAACRNTFVLAPLAMFGQKAEQGAKRISFHALPPQTQMFTWKTSPLVQVEA